MVIAEGVNAPIRGGYGFAAQRRGCRVERAVSGVTLAESDGLVKVVLPTGPSGDTVRIDGDTRRIVWRQLRPGAGTEVFISEAKQAQDEMIGSYPNYTVAAPRSMALVRALRSNPWGVCTTMGDAHITTGPQPGWAPPTAMVLRAAACELCA